MYHDQCLSHSLEQRMIKTKLMDSWNLILREECKGKKRGCRSVMTTTQPTEGTDIINKQNKTTIDICKHYE